MFNFYSFKKADVGLSMAGDRKGSQISNVNWSRFVRYKVGLKKRQVSSPSAENLKPNCFRRVSTSGGDWTPLANMDCMPVSFTDFSISIHLLCDNFLHIHI